MSWTENHSAPAYFGDIYELTLEAGARLLHEGLWDPSQASEAQILEAMRAAMQQGELTPRHGGFGLIGHVNPPAPVFDAFALARWAERQGLELERNGAFQSYLLAEAELAEQLEQHLQRLRALAREPDAGKRQAALAASRQADQGTRWLLENARLRASLAECDGQALGRREVDSLLKLVIAMAIRGYGHRPEAARSEATARIVQDLEALGIPLDPATVRKWLREAAQRLPEGSAPS